MISKIGRTFRTDPAVISNLLAPLLLSTATLLAVGSVPPNRLLELQCRRSRLPKTPFHHSTVNEFLWIMSFLLIKELQCFASNVNQIINFYWRNWAVFMLELNLPIRSEKMLFLGLYQNRWEPSCTPMWNSGFVPEEVSRNRIFKCILIAISQGHPLSDTPTSQHNWT